MSVKTLSKDIEELKIIVSHSNVKVVVTCDFTDEEDKSYYNELMSKPSNKFMRAKHHPFHSFESFLGYHRRVET